MVAHNARPVRCLETGRVFPTITAAAKFIGRESTGIINNIKGETSHCGGYHWEYADGKPAKPDNPRSRPRMTIEEVQEEAARRSRETGRRVRYKHIQIEETLALIRQRDTAAAAKLEKMKREAKR